MSDDIRKQARDRRRSGRVPATVLPPHVLREAIASQVCPWCSSGPFRSLGVHVSWVHDIPGKTFKAWAGLTTKEPTCSASLSDVLRDARVQPTAEQLNRGARLGGAASKAPRARERQLLSAAAVYLATNRTTDAVRDARAKLLRALDAYGDDSA